MQVEALEVVGLVGLTLVISVGSIFDGLRKWCAGFKHPLNLFKWFGELISCPMCTGAWVGIGWAFLDGQNTMTAIVVGGLISVSATVVNMLLGVLSNFTHQHEEPEDRTATIRQLLQARAEHKAAQLQEAHNKQLHGEDLTEEEADAILDEQEEAADRSAA